MKLAGKNIVVTGAGRGIGRAIAVAAAKEGARLALLARTSSGLLETRALLGENSGHRCHQVDVADIDAVARVMTAIEEEFGAIDGLVNNAGIQPPLGRFDSVPLHDWIHNIEVNLIGAAACTHDVIPGMVARKKGKIVNLSGGGSTSPRPNFSAYAASKTAVVRFTETIAEELRGTGVDVNAISPGAVNTRMLDEILEMKEASGAEYGQAILRREKGGDDPERAAGLAVFLLSDGSDGITGKLLSAVWDPWNEEGFRALLRSDRDIASLRRIDGKNFIRKP
ncbi:MAG TPA: SDR family oxidoreductase [Bacteroidota bacterium]|nr:SDR family oxidoreductase [Bacteroidota bacterium]